MLTGSFAANFYSVPRMTRDIDIVLEIIPTNVDAFVQTFEADFYIAKASIKEAIEHQGMFNIIHLDTVFKIDFIIRKEGLYRELEFQRRSQLQLEDELIWIVSAEDLILSKLLWAKDTSSNLQITDIQNLLKASDQLDMEYLVKWITDLSLDSIYDKVKNHA